MQIPARLYDDQLYLKGSVSELHQPMPTFRLSAEEHRMSGRASCRRGRDHELLVTACWNIGSLLRDLTARGQHPAVIAFGEDGVATWDSGTVADKALRLARGLRDAVVP
jgi:hypothetical protein